MALTASQRNAKTRKRRRSEGMVEVRVWIEPRTAEMLLKMGRPSIAVAAAQILNEEASY